jgi:hypothetical protein
MFTSGFRKTADLQEPGDDSTSTGKTVGAAGAAGAATYAALRSGAKTKLMRTQMTKAPKSALGRAWDRALYGADEIGYMPKEGVTPKRPTKFKGTVLHEYGDDKKYFKGTKNIGDFKGTKHFDDKLLESRMLNQHAAKSHTITKKMSRFTHKGLSKTYKDMQGDFIIKPKSGENSGVGGASFISNDDIENHLHGYKLSKKKLETLKHMKAHPNQYIAQKALDIKKDPITGHHREIRVHAIGGKVVPGASSPRGGNVTDILHQRKAEKFFQGALDKMPKGKKPHNMFWAPDIAVTGKGMKIIETNRGAAQSGLLDPKYIAKHRGKIPALNSVRMNSAIYKHITGRHTALAAGAKALGVAGAAGLAAHLYQKHKAKSDR